MNQESSIEELQVVDTIKSYIQERGGKYNAWNIGICQNMPDIVPLLYSTHCKHWVYYQISSFHVAAEVLNKCVNKLGMSTQHNSLHQDEGPCTLYAYQRMDDNPVEV